MVALRHSRLEISVSETMDAMQAAAQIDLTQRALLHAALRATLIKNQAHKKAFDLLFDCYFPQMPRNSTGVLNPSSIGFDEADTVANASDVDLSPEGLLSLIDSLSRSSDEQLLKSAAVLAVEVHAGMDPLRPVGTKYYLYRTMRALNVEAIVERLLAARQMQDEEAGADRPNSTSADLLPAAVGGQEIRAVIESLQAEIEAEIRRRLIAERGSEVVAKLSVGPLAENVDFAHATAEELAAMRKVLSPLAARLASRLSHRRKSHSRGIVDMRSTMRHSLGYGGVPLQIKYRRHRPAKPELWIVADISGSVAAFARFTLALVHALNSQFSKVRSFVFIDGIDEVTHIFDEAQDLSEALRRVSAEADVVWAEGNSHYGSALEAFSLKWADEVEPRTTVMILGDARSNYHDSGARFLGGIADKARKLYWLNPEPSSYWNTGDSVVSQYEPYCDGIFECRNLRQLQEFVEILS